MGIIADLENRKRRLAEALGATPTAKAAPKKKKRTHVNQFGAAELGAMSEKRFMSLRQD